MITCRDDRLLETGVRLAECLKVAGPMDVDLFVNDQGIHILEINPRFGGGYPVSHLAGADFPGMLVRLIEGHTVQPRIGEYEDDVVMVKTLSIIGGPQQEFWKQSLHIEES